MHLHIRIKHVPYFQTWGGANHRWIYSWLKVFKCWKRNNRTVKAQVTKEWFPLVPQQKTDIKRIKRRFIIRKCTYGILSEFVLFWALKIPWLSMTFLSFPWPKLISGWQFCQNNYLFQVLSDIIMHKICACVYFFWNYASFWLVCYTFNFLHSYSQRAYCFSMTFRDPQDFPGFNCNIHVMRLYIVINIYSSRTF